MAAHAQTLDTATVIDVYDQLEDYLATVSNLVSGSLSTATLAHIDDETANFASWLEEVADLAQNDTTKNLANSLSSIFNQ
jgi:hypothetical protein